MKKQAAANAETLFLQETQVLWTGLEFAISERKKSIHSNFTKQKNRNVWLLSKLIIREYIRLNPII